MTDNSIELKHVKVVFAELEDTGFGKSVTIDATKPEVKEAIEDWASAQGLKNPIKPYTNKEGQTTFQAQFKLSNYTQFGGEGEVKRGALINMVVRPYEYDNKFGKGKSSSILAIYVVEAGKSSLLDSIAE